MVHLSHWVHKKYGTNNILLRQNSKIACSRPLSGLCCEYLSVHILRSPWTRLSLDDPALHNLIEKIDAMMKEFGHATVLNVVPSIRQGFQKPYFSVIPTSISTLHVW